MVNVKVWGPSPDQDDEYPGCSFEWCEAHLNESELEGWWNLACEDGVELAASDAEEVFGQRVDVYRVGRSGGWLVVKGLPDVDEWDAVMVAKWGKFARWARATADAIPEMTLSLIAINRYEPWLAEQEAKAAECAAARLPILAGV